MVISEIKLYDLLKAKLGQEEAETFVDLLKTRADKKFEEAKQYLATKQDLAETKAEILRWTFAFVFGAVVINIVAIIAAIISISNLIKR